MANDKISVACGCGARLMAPTAMIGKRAKCPKCGVAVDIQAAPAEPIATLEVASGFDARRQIATVQATSKTWKALQGIGILGVIVGFSVACVVGNLNGAEAAAPWIVLAILALPTYLAGRIAAWWYHG